VPEQVSSSSSKALSAARRASARTETPPDPRGATRARGANTDASSEFLFREVNERIAELTGSLDGDSDGVFICECSSDACAEMVEIALNEYEAIRAHGARFVVLPGHQDRELERVVDGNGRFVVVEKIERAGEVARERDPRRP
jgi:hypothetical protein